ncbi:protein of unknown function [Nitrospira japonica]|uniref:Uncharacterized protein n=1 Tax=Nitrospira japonica TaxID=1325564 RepID=A0A1W1I2C3_9BACT|nr:protein of unknown function [Nitrospira japonica]
MFGAADNGDIRAPKDVWMTANRMNIRDMRRIVGTPGQTRKGQKLLYLSTNFVRKRMCRDR